MARIGSEGSTSFMEPGFTQWSHARQVMQEMRDFVFRGAFRPTFHH